jgi:hypothetical protein
MKDLIKALQIFQKYADLENPTYCMHDALIIVGITFEQVILEDCLELDNLGFFWDESEECFMSFRFGSA